MEKSECDLFTELLDQLEEAQRFPDEDELKELMGHINICPTHDDFSAKDFRTWGATNLSAADLYRKGAVSDEKEVKKNVFETVKEVAHHLNNTVSVCRTYYIHPTVIETYSNNLLVPHFEPYAKTRAAKRGLSWNEYALIGLLKKFA